MTEPDCKQCQHCGRERGGSWICRPLMGMLWCEACKSADLLTQFCLATDGVMHAVCRKTIRPLLPDDWREGYLGEPVNDRLMPLPSCPGFVADTSGQKHQTKKSLPGQRNLFEEDE